MLTTSAIVVSVIVFVLLLFSGKRANIFDRAEKFNKLGTTFAICTAAAWVIVQNKDAARINIDQNYNFYRDHGGNLNMFISVTVENDSEVPIRLNKRSFAVWVDRVYPSGNEGVTEISEAMQESNPAITPVLRLRGSKTSGMLISDGHEYHNDPAVLELIEEAGLDADMFYDRKDEIDEELQPSSDSVYIFWSKFSCKDPGIYITRFELEVNRSWLRRLSDYFENGPGNKPMYYRHQGLVDAAKECGLASAKA